MCADDRDIISLVCVVPLDSRYGHEHRLLLMIMIPIILCEVK